MQFPEDLLYSPDHLWVRVLQDNLVQVGVTDFAQHQLGEVKYVDLPAQGDDVEAGEEMGAVESAKSVSDLICPVEGVVIEVNESLEEQPTLLNHHPYDQGWVVRIELAGEMPADLLSAQDYQKSLE